MDTKKIDFRDILQIIQTIILVVLVVEVTIMFRDSRRGGQQAVRKPPEPKKIDVNLDELTAESQFMGDRDAKVTLVLFNSFSCGYCGRAKEPLMKLAQNFPDDLRIVYKHFNRGGNDSVSGQAVECAGEQGRFWEMYNDIFEKGARGDYTAYAKGLGINTVKFGSCMSSEKYRTKTETDTNDAVKLGIRGTPSFILNDLVIPGFRPYNVFEEMIEEKLGK